MTAATTPAIEPPERGPHDLVGRHRRHPGHQQSPVRLRDLEELGGGEARAEGLDPHPGASELLGEPFGEREHEGLA